MKITLTLTSKEKADLEHTIWLETHEFKKMLRGNSEEKKIGIKMVKMLDKVMNQLLNQPV